MLAEKAAATLKRMIYVQRINEIAEKSHAALSSGKEKLNVKYKTVAGIRPDFKREEIYKLFSNKLKSMVNEDIERGTTGQGPHRDDLDLALDGDHVKLLPRKDNSVRQLFRLNWRSWPLFGKIPVSRRIAFGRCHVRT